MRKERNKSSHKHTRRPGAWQLAEIMWWCLVVGKSDSRKTEVLCYITNLIDILAKMMAKIWRKNSNLPAESLTKSLKGW